TRSKRDWSSDVCSSDLTMVRRKTNMTRTTLRMTKSTESKINYFEAKLENNPALIKNIPSSNNGLINMLLNDYLTLIINAWNKSRSEERRVGKECRYGQR